MTTAETWLSAHGYDDGSTMWDPDHETRISDALDESDAAPTTLWLGVDGPEDATAQNGYLWPDGSGVILTDGWWDVVTGGRCDAGPLYTDADTDTVADEMAPAGWTIRRGSYVGNGGDSAACWYVDAEDSESWDRSGPGYATIQDALDACHQQAMDTPPHPAALRDWRTQYSLTAARAAEVAGVELRTWQRWEDGDRAVPQWLRDVLRQRWGSGP